MKKIKTLNINLVIIYRLLIVFAIYSICRLLYLVFNFEALQSPDAEALLKIMPGGLRFDAVGIMYINGLVILLAILPFHFRHHPLYQKLLFILFIVLNTIGIALNIIDIGYYPFIKARTTASVFSQFADETNKLNLSFQFIQDYWYLALIFIVLTTILIHFSRKIKASPPIIQNRYRYTLWASLLMPVYLFVILFLIRGHLHLDGKPLYLNDAAQYTQTPAELPLVLSTPFSLIRTIGKKSFTKRNYFQNDELMEQVMNPIHQYKNNTPFTPKNVVLIILESFGREYIGAVNSQYLKNKQIDSYTPFLDSLFQHGLLFCNGFANGRRSIDAPPALLASIPGLTVSYPLSQNANNKIKSLAHCLKEKGYTTSFYHGGSNGTMRFDTFCKVAGIDHYYGRNEYNNEADYDGMWGIWDDEYLQYFSRQLTNTEQPFFAAVFTLSSHHPFHLPDKYRGQFPEGELEIHKTIGYTDFALKHFFDLAKKTPWFDNTLFVITADHAAIPCHEEYKTLAGEYAIPLFLYQSNENLVRRDTVTLAQHIDVMPTVLDILGYNEPFFAYGKDLMKTGKKENFAVSANEDRVQYYYNNLMMVKNNGETIHWQDLSKGYIDTNKSFNPSDEEKETLIMFSNAFEQQYFNRIIENKMVAN